MKAQTITLALALVAGIGIGWLLPREGRDGGGHATAKAELLRQQLGPRSNFSRGLQARPKSTRKPAAGDGLVTVSAEMLQKINKFPPVHPRHVQLFYQNDEVLEMLKITEQEQARLEEVWTMRRAEVESLESFHSSRQDMEDGSALITVPDLSDVLTAVERELSEQVRQTLGDERGDLLIRLKHLDGVFMPKTGERTYQVRVEAAGNGQWRYHTDYRDDSNHHVWVGEDLPQEIRHITDAARIAPTTASLNEVK